jgi:hypothetical protein
MLRRQPNHSFLLVAAANSRPLALYRGLPRPEKCVRAIEGSTLVYDLGALPANHHATIRDALFLFRELPDSAPSMLLLGGEPDLVIDEHGRAQRPGGGRVLSLLRH